MLNKKDILGADDLKFVVVSVPEWNGEVKVKSMTGKERDSFESTLKKVDGEISTENIRARLCAACIVDEDGNCIFEREDIELLGEKSAAALDRVFEVAQRLNGLTAADVKELEKNSETGQSESSTLT